MVEEVVGADVELELIRDLVTDVEVGDAGRADPFGDAVVAGAVGADDFGTGAVDCLAQVHAPLRKGPVGAQHHLLPRRGRGQQAERRGTEQGGLAEQGRGDGGRQGILLGDYCLIVVEGRRPIDVTEFAEIRRVVGGKFDATGARIGAIGEHADTHVANTWIEHVAVGGDGVKHALRDHRRTNEA